MTMIDTQERRDYYPQTQGMARAIGTTHPVALFVPVVALFFVGAIVCAILTYWWTALPIAAFGALYLLPLRWNLRHRADAEKAVRLRRRAVDAGFRAHPVRAVAIITIFAFVYAAIRSAGNRSAHGWWILVWAGAAALAALLLGLWEVRRARHSRNT